MRMAELTSQVTFRVTDEQYEVIEEIARQERRKPNEVARALLERGTSAYKRDGRLFEPIRDSGTSGNAERGGSHQSRPAIETLEGRKRSNRGRKTGNDKS